MPSFFDGHRGLSLAQPAALLGHQLHGLARIRRRKCHDVLPVTIGGKRAIHGREVFRRADHWPIALNDEASRPQVAARVASSDGVNPVVHLLLEVHPRAMT